MNTRGGRSTKPDSMLNIPSPGSWRRARSPDGSTRDRGASWFRDDQQAALAIRALLGLVGLERLWTIYGPTSSATTLLDPRTGELTAKEHLILQCAWAIWDGSGTVRLADVIQELDDDATGALLLLVLALKTGPSAVDEWLIDYPAP